MNNLVPVGHRPLMELEPIRLQREYSQSTALERVLAGIYRQRWVVLATFFAVIALGALLTFNTPPQYTAVASVQLEQQVPRVMADPDLDPQVSSQDSERFLQTQLDRVRSRNTAEAVATKLNIASSPAYLGALGIENNGVSRDEVVDTLQAKMGAELGLNTRVAQISFTSHDPQASARIANAFADAFASENIDTKLETTSRAKQFLLGQLADAKAKLENAERRMLGYARSADLTLTVVPGSGEGDDRGGSLRAQQLGMMTDSLSQATARRIDAQQNWVQMQGTSPMALQEVQNNGAVQNLVQQRAQLQATLEEDRQRHTDDYPSVRETAAKIRELDGQISRLASNIQSSFFTRYAAAAQQERQLAGVVGQLRGAAMSERERSVGFNSLKREVETSKAFYDGLLQRYKEVALAMGAPTGNVTLLDRASPPQEPSSPNVGRNMALASIAGLVLALMVGSARERMHNVVRSAEDLEQGLNLPSLGVVPRTLGKSSARDALSDPMSSQSEAYHSIAAALEQASPGGLPKTLLITSSGASEGKSTSALGIARSLTAMGKRVLLIDADLRRPTSSKDFAGDGSPGLSDALAGTSTAEETVIHNEEHGFSLVRAGDPTVSPVALLSTGQIKTVLDQLADFHDIVIIDGPPIMGLADAVLLARSVSGVVMVVEANRIHTSELELAMSRLPEASLIGGVLTKFDPRSAGVRYGGTDYYKY